MGMRSRSCDGAGPARWAVWIVAAAAVSWVGPVAAQEDLTTFCRSAPDTDPCLLGSWVAEGVHPRVGLALFGGSPVPGTASTLGMRLGSMPRISLSGRLTLVPVERPGSLDGAGDADRSLMAALSGQATVGLLPGWSPLPTVGGVLAVDALVRVSWVTLPERSPDSTTSGFEKGSAWGAAGGVRIGILRESFTLPGVSITGSYGRGSTRTYLDPGGYGARGGIGSWNATAAATKRIGPVGVTGGVAWDRYTTRLELAPMAGPSAVAPTTLDASVARWAAFGNLSWTFLVAHVSLEGGWQSGPSSADLPTSVVLDPPAWWAGAALRLSI
jgi:hypothetical protein